MQQTYQIAVAGRILTIIRDSDGKFIRPDELKVFDSQGSALKPGHEPIALARKPLDGTLIENVLKWGVGGINIDKCRVEYASTADREAAHANALGPVERGKTSHAIYEGGKQSAGFADTHSELGRWPANVIHNGEVIDVFPNDADRYFYCAKASSFDRDEGLDGLPVKSAGERVLRTEGTAGMNSPRAGAGRTNGSRNHHATVKPTELMRHLCRLIVPPNGVVLDHMAGSFSTGKAAMLEDFRFIGIELDKDRDMMEVGRLRVMYALACRQKAKKIAAELTGMQLAQ